MALAYDYACMACLITVMLPLPLPLPQAKAAKLV